MSCGIYKITNPDGKVYIGQSVDIEGRFKGYKGLKYHLQKKLHGSLLKHGVNAHKFEIICECEREELAAKERHYRLFYNVVKDGLNGRITSLNPRKYLKDGIRRINLDIDTDVYMELAALAKDQGTNVKNLSEKYIIDYIETLIQTDLKKEK